MDAHIGWLAAKLGGVVTSAALLAQSVEPPPGTSLWFIPIIMGGAAAATLDGLMYHVERAQGLPRRQPWLRALTATAALVGGYHAVLYVLVFAGMLSVSQLGPVWLRPVVPVLMVMLVCVILGAHALVREQHARQKAEAAAARAEAVAVKLREALEQVEREEA